MRLLITADIHLGRRPRRLPAELAERYACSRVWQDIVDAAIQNKVQAVLLAGDIVDADNRFFEAIGPLERGLKQLREHGIRSLAVSGNHDHDVLPRLADETGLHVLGQGGTWEVVSLEHEGKPRLQVVGWSFPSRHVHQSPLPALAQLPLDSALPVVGLLHGDLDNPESPYGPIQKEELRNSPVACWVLGHIHKPTTRSELSEAPILYPGCPQGCDPGPGNIGMHGPWILDLSEGSPSFEQLPLARLRYQDLTISFDRVTDAGDVQPRVMAAMQEAVATHKTEQPNLEVLALRLYLSGATPLPTARLEEQLAALRENGLHLDDVQIHVHSIISRTTLPIDLQKLAEEAGLLGELARLLRLLDQPEATWDEETLQLVEEAERRLKDVGTAPAFQGLQPLANPRRHATQRLRQQAWRLLAQLNQSEALP